MAEHVCFREMEFRDNTMSAIRMEDVIENRRVRTNNINHCWVASLDDVSSIMSGGFFDTISEQYVFWGCDENKTQISLFCTFTMGNHGKSMNIHLNLIYSPAVLPIQSLMMYYQKMFHFMALP